ncbi:MAG: hypothetical protein HC896_07825 [Bacteroidales bacterium]|nr:hypothetical protein [Bacteroidales bacterium]
MRLIVSPFRLLHDTTNTAKNLQNIGLCYAQLEDFDLAGQYLLESEKIYELLSDSFNLYKAKIILADVKVKAGDYQASIELLKEALTFFKDSARYPYEHASLTYGLGISYLNLSRTNEAIYWLSVASRISEWHSYNKILSNVYLLLSEAYKKSKDYKNAYLYYTFYSDLGEKIFKGESAKRLQELEKNSSLEQKERQLAEKMPG